MNRRGWTLSLLPLLAAAPLSAQVPDGGEFQVNTYTTNAQFQPAVAADAAGNLVVVWNSLVQDGSPLGGIFGQRFAAGGAPRGFEFQVNTYTTGRQEYPVVASDSAGNFVVAWASYQEGSQRGVFAQRYDANGTPRGAEFRVNTYTTGDQRRPRIACDASGSVLVVWSSSTQGASHDGVMGQKYDAAGVPLGGEFPVAVDGAGSVWPGAVAADPAGRFIVVWHYQGPAGSSHDVFARRYDALGAPIGAEFQVNAYTAAHNSSGVATDAAGGFVVVWTSTASPGGHGFDVAGRMFDPSAVPRGPEFRINTYTTWHQLRPTVAADVDGKFVVAWEDGYQGTGYEVFARAFHASGQPRGREFLVNTYTTSSQRYPAAAPLPRGGVLMVWTSEGWFPGTGQDGDLHGVFGQRFAAAIVPATLAVDTVASQGSDGNRILEPGESVDVRPSWRNLTGATQMFDGQGLDFTGPSAAGVSYELVDDVAVYGTVGDGATVTCAECYGVRVGFGGVRPFTHWDTVLTERLTTGQTKPWTLHVGQSFADVPMTSLFYRDVETLLHNGITGGCMVSQYCSGGHVTRDQMAVFTLKAREGADYRPPVCGPTPMFADVPPSSFFCPWVQELARRGVVSGCSGGNYCPAAPVTRDQMPVFVLRLLDPTLDPPACTTPMFADVPAGSPFCRWIEELARRGVVAGCGGGNYCPAAPVTRDQMAAFLTGTYSLTLYGP